MKIAVDENTLKNQEKNLLYKLVGVRATGKESITTGEIDKNSLKLIEFIPYNPEYNEEKFEKMVARGTEAWKGVDVDKWINEIRGRDDV